MEPSLYSSTDIIRATRVCTYRQLDYWARTEVVRPSVEARGSGSQRAYTLDEVVALALVAATSQVGASLPRGAVEAAAAGMEWVVLLPSAPTVRPRLMAVDSLDVLDHVYDATGADLVAVIACGAMRRRLAEQLHEWCAVAA